ncbi:copper amine oxidase N-terminal domain-containing protein [Paenibacillus tepidiphilus]|uniref:copper amine oxidase N-terminal domain-containing protein n=1 Tax=Paenibacillus tepidiphilus TaxID=2608683 RepID=UPI001239E485|nr:copper amine oxidase N-terminal domain-containing protein [Paenibacillus tepidiphilus]
MKKFAACSILSILFVVFMAGTSMAKSSQDITITVNKDAVDTEVAALSFIERGTTMVPLKVIQAIPGIQVVWSNSTKTVTVVRDKETITLVAGQKSAFIGNKKVDLPVASQLKQGRVVVPLRFIAEAAEAYVGWNPYTREVYVVKATPEMIAKTQSDNLAAARKATLELPTVRTLKPITQIEEFTIPDHTYYFPEGRADQVFMTTGSGIEYLEAVGGRLEQKWIAKLGDQGAAGPYFLSSRIVEEVGTQPKLTSDRVVFFRTFWKIGSAEYGFIDQNGKVTTLGQQDMPSSYEFFEVPGENAK